MHCVYIKHVVRIVNARDCKGHSFVDLVAAMKRIPALDGVRGIAILLVLVWHYYVPLIPKLTENRESVVGYIDKVCRLTWSGVDLFFVLSGFLITGILLKNREASNVLAVFYIRRVFRILPLYLLVLTMFVVIGHCAFARAQEFQPLFANPMPLWSYFTFTQNFFMGARGSFGAEFVSATWSLAVEEQFYLIIPFVVLFLGKRSLIVVLCTAVFAAPLLRWLSPGFIAFVNTPWRADSLLMGALLAIALGCTSIRTVLCSANTQVAIAFCVAATLAPAISGVFSHFWLAITYSLLVLLAVQDGQTQVKGWLAAPLLVWLGRHSYGIYLFHLPISGFCDALLSASVGMLFSETCALLITLALAAISFRYFETPFLKFGLNWQYSASSPQKA